jgi:hypothetical protein
VVKIIITVFHVFKKLRRNMVGMKMQACSVMLVASSAPGF